MSSVPVSPALLPGSPSGSGSELPEAPLDSLGPESPSNGSNGTGTDTGYNSHTHQGESPDHYNASLHDQVQVPQSFPPPKPAKNYNQNPNPPISALPDDIPYGELIVRSKKKEKARERDLTRLRSRSDADRSEPPMNLNAPLPVPPLSHSNSISSPEDSPTASHHQLTTGATAEGGQYEILRIDRPSPPRTAGGGLISGSESDSEASNGNGFSQKNSLSMNGNTTALQAQSQPLPAMPTTPGPSRPIGSPGTYKRSPPPVRNIKTPGHQSSASFGGNGMGGLFSPGPTSSNRPPYPAKPGTAMGRRRAPTRGDGTATAAPSRRGSMAMGMGQGNSYIYSGPMTEDEPDHLEPVSEKDIENWTSALDPWNESAESMFQSDNIAVCVRLRPDRDRREAEDTVWQVTDFSIAERNGGSPIYYFSRVFKPDATTIQVYEKVALPIVQQFLEGYNGTVFAYGQTGSGKSFTILGTLRNPGIIYLSLSTIFRYIHTSHDTMFLIRVSFMEIYNESVNDLLNPKNRDMQIRDAGNSFKVVGLTEKIVTHVGEIITIIKQGLHNRRVGVSNLNEHSSRSHSIFRIVLESAVRTQPTDSSVTTQKLRGLVKVSELALVDLAGSETLSYEFGASQQKETKAINLSLTQLKSVITALSKGEQFVPYRNSALTKILRTSLGGNARTAVICTAHPGVSESKMTKNTLIFGSLAKDVKNRAVVNETVDNNEAMLQQYKVKIEQMEEKLKKFDQLEAEKAQIQREFQRLQEHISALKQKEAEEQQLKQEMAEQLRFVVTTDAKLEETSKREEEARLAAKLAEEELEAMQAALLSAQEQQQKLRDLLDSQAKAKADAEDNIERYEAALEDQRRQAMAAQLQLAALEREREQLEFQANEDFRNAKEKMEEEFNKLEKERFRQFRAREAELRRSNMETEAEKAQVESQLEALRMEQENLSKQLSAKLQEANEFGLDRDAYLAELINAFEEEIDQLKKQNVELRDSLLALRMDAAQRREHAKVQFSAMEKHHVYLHQRVAKATGNAKDLEDEQEPGSQVKKEKENTKEGEKATAAEGMEEKKNDSRVGTPQQRAPDFLASPSKNRIQPIDALPNGIDGQSNSRPATGSRPGSSGTTMSGRNKLPPLARAPVPPLPVTLSMPQASFMNPEDAAERDFPLASLAPAVLPLESGVASNSLPNGHSGGHHHHGRRKHRGSTTTLNDGSLAVPEDLDAAVALEILQQRETEWRRQWNDLHRKFDAIVIDRDGQATLVQAYQRTIEDQQREIAVLKRRLMQQQVKEMEKAVTDRIMNQNTNTPSNAKAPPKK